MDVKKAFEQFKKELKKETGIYGGFVMNRAQIAKGTATKLICNMKSYESEIAYFEKWRNETTKDGIKESCAKYIATNNAEREKYGTKENYARAEVERITNSNAFKKFSEEVGGVKCSTEIKTEFGIDYMYLRFHY